MPLSGKEIEFRQIPPAPPTGQGITDKATLSSQGNSVLTKLSNAIILQQILKFGVRG